MAFATGASARVTSPEDERLLETSSARRPRRKPLPDGAHVDAETNNDEPLHKAEPFPSEDHSPNAEPLPSDEQPLNTEPSPHDEQSPRVGRSSHNEPSPIDQRSPSERASSNDEQDTPTVSDSIPSSHDVAKHRHNLLRLWYPELLTLALSLAAFAGIIAVVVPYVGKGLPDWPRAISVNAIISILTVTLRAGVVYVSAQALSQHKWTWFSQSRPLSHMTIIDGASRGPWGCVLLLASPSSWSVSAALAAAIIILSIATGPMVQQLVRYEACQLPSSNSKAFIPRQALYWYMNSDDATRSPPSSVQSAIFDGVFASDPSQTLASCLSGTCSFPEVFHTVGVYSSCTDVTAQLTIARPTEDLGDVRGINYTLPSWNDAHGSKLDNLTLSTTIYSKQDPTYAQHLLSQVPSYEHCGKTLAPFRFIFELDSTMMKVNCTQQEADDAGTSWQCRGYAAVECNIKPHVSSINATVINGTTTETVVNSTETWAVGSVRGSDHGYALPTDTDWMAYDLSIEPKDGDWYNLTDAGNTRHVPYANNETLADAALQSIDPMCLFQMSQHSHCSMHTWLGTLLDGSITQHSRLIGPAALLKLLNSPKISLPFVQQVFSNIAASISSEMRATGSPELPSTLTDGKPPKNVSDANSPAAGVLMEPATCVHVQWLWLIFPAALIALTATLLVMTMFNSSLKVNRLGYEVVSTTEKPSAYLPTRGHPWGVWNSSILPLMYHGLDDDNLRRECPSAVLPLEVMEETAKSTKAQFEHTDKGWKLVKTD
ncbi:uncharacterized protein AB675_132 [Cyphellophora attinorum]|uniref:Uncharacterized protein n=1 Tax=Cyphellophora attinorum TaxID=1664694 RepID=A0A0N1H7P9_9EURO|nr:uncharacterized protein AB675_132 [Phialophora attinorum]KPI37675.1 hypothetical protein AB675_132 [Phialophora attinorum]